MSSSPRLLKIVLVGEPKCSKTNIISQFFRNSFEEEYKPTTGVEFTPGNVAIDGVNYRLQVWGLYYPLKSIQFVTY